MNRLSTLIATTALTAVLPIAANGADVNIDSETKLGLFGNDRHYEVTITNASSTFFTPLLVVAHKEDIKLFEVGAPPSDALAEIAESGGTGGFTDLLPTVPDLVDDFETTQGLLEPGSSVVVNLEAGRRFNRLSLAAMLLPTNDSFVGLESVRLPTFRGQSVRYTAVGYDAGSETNDELCANIPGPQCMGAGPSPDDDGEGYVRVSPGIAGIADVSVAAYDWRNPVAIVTVTRTR